MMTHQNSDGPREIATLLVEVARRHTVGGVSRTIVDGLMALVGGGEILRVAIWLGDADEPDAAPSPGAVAGAEGRGEEPMIVRAMASGRSVLITDEDDWNDQGGYPAWAGRAGVVGYAALPMTHRDHKIGVLSVHAAVGLEDLFPEARPELQFVADHGAACIANARASEQLRQVAARLEVENGRLRGEVRHLGGFGEILGATAGVRRCLEQIELAAGTSASVLIHGEAGTGKELMARAIHLRTRRRGPFVRVACGSIPPDGLELELVGSLHAEVGADPHLLGALGLADGGTLFLQDVDILPFDVQHVLQRALADPRHSRVRFVASTTRDLEAAVGGQRFHEELFHRISVLRLDVPPLRERADDVGVLAAAFLRRNCERLGAPNRTLAPAEAERLTSYDWPGNVRELQAVMEVVATAMVAGKPLDVLDVLLPRGKGAGPPAQSVRILTDAEFRRRERENMLAALTQADWKVAGRAGAAARLDIKPTTLAARLRVMGIQRPPRGGPPLPSS